MPLEIENIFVSSALEFMRDEIKSASGNEVFFGINFNQYFTLEHVEVIARGNENSAPAIITLALEYDAVIHNHPSGILTPSKEDLDVASSLGNNAGVGFYIINNAASEIYEVVKPIKAEQINPLDEADTLYMFADGGLLSKTLSKYEYRQEQTELVEATIKAMNDNKHLISEAGTGIGKSLSYLVPAMLWLKNNKTRIVVSTNTINLQQQIISKDIPAIIEAVAPSVKYALVKGRYNYVCIRKVKDAIKDNSKQLFDNFEQEQFFNEINSWLESTKDGSITDLGHKPKGELWELVACDNDTCTHRKCEYLEGCYFYKMRKQLNASQLLIVNHHILCADLALYKESGGRYNLLPRYSKVIIDEAHNFENSASSYFGAEGSKTSVVKTLNYISNHNRAGSKKYGIVERIKEDIEKHKSVIESEDYEKVSELINKVHVEVSLLKDTLDDNSKKFFQYCKQSLTGNIITNSYKFRVSSSFVANEHWKSKGSFILGEIAFSINKTVTTIDLLLRTFYDIAGDKGIDFEEIAQLANAYTERLRNAFSTLNTVIDFKKDESIRWIEAKISKKGHLFLSWHLTPVEIATELSENLYKRFDTVALYSATLTVQKSFSFFSKRLGFNLIEENKKLSICINSPFNYKDNSRLYIASDAIDSQSVEFNNYISKIVLKTADITGGRSFVLFTSFNSLKTVYDNTVDILKKKNINILAQIGNTHRHVLLDTFKSSDNNILFGVDSFWEGVDVSGRSLEVVIIPKLPFAVPTDPISEGRYEYIEENGGNAFVDYALPFAVIKFKQGFGRLIRSKDDRGVVIVLDKRLITKQYGRQFIESLPNTTLITASNDKILNDMDNFFSNY